MGMERGIIEVDVRDIVRSMRTAMQGSGSVIRALVELITNSDDSYIRLEEEIGSLEGLIEVIYKKEGYSGLFAVRDYAEGMSIEDVRNSFKTYGKPTSGMKAGKRVRGYFGHGAKDALAAMIDGKICTFKENQFVECRIFIEDEKPWYEIDRPVKASSKLRKTHRIRENGTVAYFRATPKITGNVPQISTVHESLANNYLLRKIMTNPQRKVLLSGPDDSKPRPLRKRLPKGVKILEEELIISYGNYGDFPINISIWRADKELTQKGDDRDGGLLLVDDEDVVLGISLFRYEHEPLAARFFGEVQIGRFRELLSAEEPVLREERDGLENRHPFCNALIVAIEKRLEAQVQEEKLRKQREARSKLGREENKRYKKAFSILNEIAETEVQEIKNLGRDLANQLEEPPSGFCIYPSDATITVGKRYAFELRVNSEVVPRGSVVNVSSTSPKVRILTPKVVISSDEDTEILHKYITVEGTEPGTDGILRATTGKNLSEATIFVVPEKELLLSEGMLFQPESVTLRPNQPRRIFLLVYVKIIDGGSIINIMSDNESIRVSRDNIVVDEFVATRHIAKYELEVWGEGADQDAPFSHISKCW